MSEPCCNQGHPLTSADLLKWRQRETEIASLRSRLAEAEALLRGIRHNFYMAQQWADRIDAFLAANSASGVEK